MSDPAVLKMVLCTADLDAARRFYTGVLGLPCVEAWDQAEGRGCVVAVGDALLELSEVPRSRPGHDAAFEAPVANDKILLQLQVPSVQAWAERLAGVWPHEAPVDRPWGHRYLYLRDPDGMRVGLYEVRADGGSETGA